MGRVILRHIAIEERLELAERVRVGERENLELIDELVHARGTELREQSPVPVGTDLVIHGDLRRARQTPRAV